MKCPKCSNARNAVSNNCNQRVHDELGQIMRYRDCSNCGHRWTTLELSAVEVQRLRSLAHWAVMHGVQQ